MHGRINSYDTRTRFGLLSDANGVQHKFPATEWLGPNAPQPGQPVEFNLVSGSAVGVSPTGPAPAGYGGFTQQGGNTGNFGMGMGNQGGPLGGFLNMANNTLSGAANPFGPSPMGGNGPQSFWQFYFSPNGRVSRAQYWQRFVLPFGLVGLIIIGAAIYCGFLALHGRLPMVFLFVALGVVLLKVSVLGWVSFVMHVKRYHDLGMSWGSAWVVDNFMPFGQDWMTWRVLFQHGVAGPNQYGPDPREYGG